MLEVGIALIAANLPVIRNLWRGLSAESIIRSIRSAISLRSHESGRESRSETQRRAEGSDSKTAIIGVFQGRNPGMDSVNGEAYAMGKLSGERAFETAAGSNEIWRETEIEQTSNVV